LKLNARSLATICIMATFISPLFAQDTASDIYTAKCKMCHGVDGLGNTPAGRIAKIVSFKDPSTVKTPDGDLVATIKNGKNKMPAFAGKLTDDQINSLVAYIRILQK